MKTRISYIFLVFIVTLLTGFSAGVIAGAKQPAGVQFTEKQIKNISDYIISDDGYELTLLISEKFMSYVSNRDKSIYTVKYVKEGDNLYFPAVNGISPYHIELAKTACKASGDTIEIIDVRMLSDNHAGMFEDTLQTLGFRTHRGKAVISIMGSLPDTFFCNNFKQSFFKIDANTLSALESYSKQKIFIPIVKNNKDIIAYMRDHDNFISFFWRKP